LARPCRAARKVPGMGSAICMQRARFRRCRFAAMATPPAWRLVGAMALLNACAGDPFVVGAAPPDASAGDEQAPDVDARAPEFDALTPGSDAPADAESDAPLETGNVVPAKSSDVPCGDQSCKAKICCNSVAGNSSSCTAGTCGCSSELLCASDANCSGLQGICCIRSVSDTSCAAGHYVATCLLACAANAKRLCDPSSTVAGCPIGKTCSGDSADLASVGLPPGYGVCK